VAQNADDARYIPARQIDAGDEDQPVVDHNDLLIERSTARVFGAPQSPIVIEPPGVTFFFIYNLFETIPKKNLEKTSGHDVTSETNLT
jgi:hypothetical protein